MGVRVATWGSRGHHLQGRFVMALVPKVKVSIGVLSPSGTETLSSKITKTSATNTYRYGMSHRLTIDGTPVDTEEKGKGGLLKELRGRGQTKGMFKVGQLGW